MKKDRKYARALCAWVLMLALLSASGCTGWTQESSSASSADASSAAFSGRVPDDKPVWQEVSSNDPLASPVGTALPQIKTAYAAAKMKLEYDELPGDSVRQAYDAMLQAVGKITLNRNEQGEYCTERVFLEGIQLSEQELRLALSALRSDNPQIFWITNRFGYYSTPGGTSVELYSYYSAKECTQRSQKLVQAVRKVVSVLHEGQTLFDRELALHDTLLQFVAYDKEAVTSSNRPEPFTAYGALVEGKAVCQGYALAMKLLLCYAGIQSTIISGTSQGIAHAWNAVELNNQWYYLDPTWDDTEQNVRYDYFNITSEILQLDHTVDPVYPGDGTGEQYNLRVPQCVAVTENYFIRRAVYLDGFDSNNDHRLLARLQAMLASGSTTLTVRFDPSMDYDDSIAKLITGQPYKLVYLMQEANQMYGSVNSFAMNDLQYTKAKAQNAVTIWLKMENGTG